jgi:sugar lactone lactonase YvrE
LTIGDDITAYTTSSAAVAADQAAVTAANTQLATDTTKNGTDATTLKTDLAAVGGAAFSPDGSTVYLSDASSQGFHTVVPVPASTTVPPPPAS